MASEGDALYARQFTKGEDVQDQEPPNRAPPAAAEADDPRPSWLKRQADQVAIDIQTTCPCKNRKLAPLAAADAVELAGKLKILSPEVGREPNKAAYHYNIAILEAYRAATWSAAVEAAVAVCDKEWNVAPDKIGKHLACLIRALKPTAGEIYE